ncbi:MAG: CHAD domain-containing protein [bacterium]|nr:CHAD domain-containing protein [bacterium]
MRAGSLAQDCAEIAEYMVTRPTRSLAAASLDCATVFRNIAMECVALIEAHQEAACVGDAEAVHQSRVAITRLRAAVAFFAPIVRDDEWLRLKTEIAWLNDALGAARDSDVVVAYAGRKRYRSWAEGVFGESLDSRRAQHHRRLLRRLRSVRFRRLIAALAEWAGRGPARPDSAEPLERYCDRQLKSWRERLIRKGRHLDRLDGSRRHRLRIRVKRFRYMLEALKEIIPLRGRGEWRRSAKRLQRVLGEIRDIERLCDLAGNKPPPGYRRRRDALLGSAVEAYRDFKRAGAR